MEREATPEGFHGIQFAHKSEEKLTKLQWQTYEILWHNGPLDQKEINLKAQGAYGTTMRPLWAAQLKKLKAMGLVSEYTVKKWDVTCSTVPTELEVVKKPSAKKFKKGVSDLELAMVKADNVGLATDEAQSVLSWLHSKV